MGAFAVAIASATFGSFATRALAESLSGKTSRSCQLRPGQTHSAASGESITLPARAKKGDQICLIVQAESLNTPAKVLSLGERIAGDKEDLILDSLGIFHLTYEGQRAGWTLS